MTKNIHEFEEIKSRKPLVLASNPDYKKISEEISKYNQKVFNRQYKFVKQYALTEVQN